MTRIARRSGTVVGGVLALAFILLPGGVGPSNVSGAAAALPAWHGGIDLYRKGTFTTQKSWLCITSPGQCLQGGLCLLAGFSFVTLGRKTLQTRTPAFDAA